MNKQPRHTPGPWAVLPPIEGATINGYLHRLYPISGDENNPVESTGVAICVIPNEDLTAKTINYVQANARLIAQAPSMYELLNELLTEMEADWNEPGYQLSDFEMRLQQVVQTINPNRCAPESDTVPDYTENSF